MWNHWNFTSLEKATGCFSGIHSKKWDWKRLNEDFKGNVLIFIFFVWQYSVKLGRKVAVFTCSGVMKTWKPMVVFIETWGFWRCERPSAFNIAKTPSFNETTIGFKFSTPRTRETANIRPSFTETVIKKKERFPLKTVLLADFTPITTFFLLPVSVKLWQLQIVSNSFR